MTHLHHADLITTSKEDVLALPLGHELWIIAQNSTPNEKLKQLYGDVLYREIVFGNLVRELRDLGQFSSSTRAEIKSKTLIARLKRVEKRVRWYCAKHHWKRSELLTSA